MEWDRFTTREEKSCSSDHNKAKGIESGQVEEKKGAEFSPFES